MNILLVGLQSLTLIIVLFSIYIIYNTFKNFYGGMGITILVTYAMFALYNALEIIILSIDDASKAIVVSRISSCILATGYYLLHYFHDELSAEYRQRKTMILGSLIYGAVVAGAWFENSLAIDPITGAPFVSTAYGMLIVFQAGLSAYRLTSHILIMSRLSDHYGVRSAISTKFRSIIHRAISISVFFAIIMMLFIDNIISLPFAMLTAVGLFMLATLYKLDPISAVPIAQPMKAISLIRGDEVRFSYMFSEDIEEFVGQDDFGSFVTNLSSLYVDIMKSDKSIRSLSTRDYLFLFESCGEDYLLLILESKAPFVRRILQSLSRIIYENQVTNQYQFSQLVQKHLLFPNQ